MFLKRFIVLIVTINCERIFKDIIKFLLYLLNFYFFFILEKCVYYENCFILILIY